MILLNGLIFWRVIYPWSERQGQSNQDCENRTPIKCHEKLENGVDASRGYRIRAEPVSQYPCEGANKEPHDKKWCDDIENDAPDHRKGWLGL